MDDLEEFIEDEKHWLQAQNEKATTISSSFSSLLSPTSP
jgi:hypothetical protein